MNSTHRSLAFLSFLFLLALLWACPGCSSEETKDGGGGSGQAGAAGEADEEYRRGLNLENTADSMKSFHCLSRYQQAMLYYDAALRKGGDGWSRRKETKDRIQRIAAHVETLKKWKRVLDRVRADVGKVRSAGSLRTDLFASCEKVIRSCRVAWVVKEAQSLVRAVKRAFLATVEKEFRAKAQRTRTLAAAGRYVDAVDVWQAFPAAYREQYPAVDKDVKDLLSEIDRAARDDFETLVQKRVDYLIERDRFFGAAWVVRKARSRFLGFNRILDRLDALAAEVEEARRKAAAKPKPAPKPAEASGEGGKPKPAPKPKPGPAPKPKPEAKPDTNPTPGPFGAMGGSREYVRKPLKKARDALSEARKYDRLSMPGADNYDENLKKAVDLYRRAMELFEVCQDHGIGNPREVEEQLEEINSALFWCQKRRRIAD